MNLQGKPGLHPSIFNGIVLDELVVTVNLFQLQTISPEKSFLLFHHRVSAVQPMCCHSYAIDWSQWKYELIFLDIVRDSRGFCLIQGEAFPHTKRLPMPSCQYLCQVCQKNAHLAISWESLR